MSNPKNVSCITCHKGRGEALLLKKVPLRTIYNDITDLLDNQIGIGFPRLCDTALADLCVQISENDPRSLVLR